MKNKTCSLICLLFAVISLFSFLTATEKENTLTESSTPYLFSGESLPPGKSLFLYSDNSEWEKIELVVEEKAMLYLYQNGEKIKVWDCADSDNLSSGTIMMTPSGKFVIFCPYNKIVASVLGYEIYSWEATHNNVPGSYLALEKTEDSARIAIYSPTHELLWSSETGHYFSLYDEMGRA